MSKQVLKESLELLKSEIETLEADHRTARERLDKLVEDLEHQIENLDDTEHRKSMLEDMSGFIDKFETSHPRVTAVLDQITVTLSNMGI